MLRLTEANVRSLTLSPDQSERIVWDTDIPGFGVRIRQGGGRHWVIRPPRAGNKSSIYVLAPVVVVALKSARGAARERLASAFLGEDVRAAKRVVRQQAATTIQKVFGEYIASMECCYRPATFRDLKNHLNVHWKPLHGLALNDVRRLDVASRLRQITAKHGPHAANRARVVLMGFFNWAIGEGLAENNPVIGTNKPIAEKARSRVLKDTELAAVWRACHDDDFGRILRLLILTGQRRDEVAGMAWSEIDLAADLWTLPEERSKNRRAHEIPLPAAARAIVASLPRRPGREFVFGRAAGPYSGFSKAKASLDQRLGTTISAPWRIHDLRRTAATGMANLGVLPHVVEAVLNHVSGHKAGVAGVYNYATYTNEKRAALDLWAAHVVALVGHG